MAIAPIPSPTEVATRKRILEAAQHLFAAQGYESTTTRDLAQAAGVAEGTLFRHFAAKKTILITLMRQGWRLLLEDLLDELSEMSDRRALGSWLRHHWQASSQHRELLRICLLELQFHPELRSLLETEVLTTMEEVLEAFCQTAVAQGLYRDLPCRTLARLLLNLFLLVELLPLSPLSGEDSEAQIACLASVIEHGLILPAEEISFSDRRTAFHSRRGLEEMAQA